MWCPTFSWLQCGLGKGTNESWGASLDGPKVSIALFLQKRKGLLWLLAVHHVIVNAMVQGMREGQGLFSNFSFIGSSPNYTAFQKNLASQVLPHFLRADCHQDFHVHWQCKMHSPKTKWVGIHQLSQDHSQITRAREVSGLGAIFTMRLCVVELLWECCDFY